MSYKIGEVARQARISIKTLHHYDAIGLLSPTGRTESGYRLYSMQDMLRLQQILFYRELEFSLEAIQQLLSQPGFDYLTALKEQKTMLEEKQQKLSGVLGLINKMIAYKEEDIVMSLKDMFDVFPDITEGMVAEAERDWGHTEAHRESLRRSKNYTRADWEQMKTERNALQEHAQALFREGAAPDDPRVQDMVDQQRLLIDKWHYPCDKPFYARLSEMTASDERYRKNMDADCPGLAAFIRDAAAILATNA